MFSYFHKYLVNGFSVYSGHLLTVATKRVSRAMLCIGALTGLIGRVRRCTFRTLRTLSRQIRVLSVQRQRQIFEVATWWYAWLLIWTCKCCSTSIIDSSNVMMGSDSAPGKCLYLDVTHLATGIKKSTRTENAQDKLHCW